MPTAVQPAVAPASAPGAARRDRAALCSGAVPVGAAAFRRAADVHQDGAAGARRVARGVVDRARVLPGPPARRLLLCPSPGALLLDPGGAGAASRAHARRRAEPADRLPA